MGRREKKLEKKKSKRTEKKRELTRVASMGVVAQIRRAAHEPVVHCATHGDRDATQGVTQLLFSRRLPDGKVALAIFLIDRWCLGIKHVTIKIASAQQYRDFHKRLQGDMPGLALDPPTARRLVEDAIAFALKYGLPPHRDTPKALPIFGDVDAAAAARTFEFGKDGKPFYVAGPNDSMSRQLQIVAALAHTAGEGNFHYTMHASDLADFGLTEDELQDAFDDKESSETLQTDDDRLGDDESEESPAAVRSPVE